MLISLDIRILISNSCDVVNKIRKGKKNGHKKLNRGRKTELPFIIL